MAVEKRSLKQIVEKTKGMGGQVAQAKTPEASSSNAVPDTPNFIPQTYPPLQFSHYKKIFLFR
ncbi:hypothetical protein HWD97_17065 [Ochrobactrum sp. C6C9]|uniref:hypothetical protein n=1 Tax=Ochrobactrum sp. C6C9 TaxID=2736662 RepID=UPI00353051F1|nr:hypothetical protein [Ochrobactrum sp. C6C9]